jgi:DNA modification methylase
MAMTSALVLRGDARSLPLPDASVDLIVTSPPYFGLRSYTDGGEHYEGQIGSEATPAEFIAALIDCTREWVRVLKPSGSIFVNLGDKYSGGGSGENGTGKSSLNGHGGEGTQRDRVKLGRSKPVPGALPKSLLGLPWRYAIAATDQLGLILRRDIIWSKPNGLPESVTDRCRSSHEYLFHLVKQPRYYAAVDEIREPHAPPGGGRGAVQNGTRVQVPSGGRNAGISGIRPEPNPLGKLPGSVWDIPSQPLTVPAALGIDHFAAFPMELPRRCILGWSPPGVCTGCGEGRRPVVDKQLVGGHLAPNARDYRRAANTANGGVHWDVIEGRTEATITGYACACPQPDAPTRPAAVLDPFGGTGTTATVASVLGRTGITVDRSADYCRLAKWRTQDPGERCRVIGAPKPPPVAEGQAALFA